MIHTYHTTISWYGIDLDTMIDFKFYHGSTPSGGDNPADLAIDGVSVYDEEAGVYREADCEVYTACWELARGSFNLFEDLAIEDYDKDRY